MDWIAGPARIVPSCKYLQGYKGQGWMAHAVDRVRKQVWLVGQRGMTGSICYGLRQVDLAAEILPWRPPPSMLRNAVAAQAAAIMLTLMRSPGRMFQPGELFSETYGRLPDKQESKHVSMALGTFRGLDLIDWTLQGSAATNIRFR